MEINDVKYCIIVDDTVNDLKKANFNCLKVCLDELIEFL